MAKFDKAKQREQNIKSNMGRCIHFRGIQHELCGAGVNLREIVGGADLGWAARLPCLTMDAENCVVTCNLRKYPTREEAEAEETEHEERITTFLSASREAHEHAAKAGLKRGNGGVGEMPCPKKCGGSLQYSVAGVNGHMHARCTTKDCLMWME